MKEIQLTKGKVALVDDADFDFVAQWKWHAAKGRAGCWYAQRTDYRHGKKTISLQRALLALELTPETPLADHKDGDGLNNQRYNLRACTPSKNCQNRKPRGATACGYKGVSWHGRNSMWCAEIGVTAGKILLGYFRRAIDAAVAYDQAALRHFGEFSRLNFSYDPACFI